MTEFLHTPWGLNHRVYRKTVTFLGVEEEINFCDACGMEVYPALFPWTPAGFVRLDSLD